MKIAHLAVALLMLAAAFVPSAVYADGGAPLPDPNGGNNTRQDVNTLRAYATAVRKRLHDHLIYPQEAKNAGIGGYVGLSFTIGQSGDVRPETVRVVTSSGHPELDDGARQTVLAASPFSPPSKEMSLQTSIVFEVPVKAIRVNEDFFKSARSNGTGFFVNKDGVVVTARHVVDGCERIGVLKDRILFMARRAVVSNDTDVALLFLGSSVKVAEPAVLSSRDAPRDGEAVYFLGDNDLRNAKDDHPAIVNAIVSGDPMSSGQFSMLGSGVPGYSGSPVLDADNHVVGIVNLKRAYDVKRTGVSLEFLFEVGSLTSSVIRKALDDNHVSYVMERSGQKPSATPQQLIDKKISVGIFCLP